MVFVCYCPATYYVIYFKCKYQFQILIIQWYYRHYISDTNLILIKLNNNIYIKSQNSEISFNINSNVPSPLNYVIYINSAEYESIKFLLVLQFILFLHNRLSFCVCTPVSNSVVPKLN